VLCALGKGVANSDVVLGTVQVYWAHREESLGDAWRGAHHLNDTMVADELWERSVKTGEPYYTGYRCKNKEGRVVLQAAQWSEFKLS
jgi:hypothetical protein